MSIYTERRSKLFEWMERENITVAIFEDTEGRRDPSIRWLSGHPGDALMVLTVDKHSMLIPWDMNLSMRMSDADVVIAYSEFERSPINALQGVANYFQLPLGSRIEVPPQTPYPLFLSYVEALSDYDVICHEEGGIHAELTALRAIKDATEIELYRQLSSITNELIDLLEKMVREQTITTEIDAALFIEAQCRKCGCEGTGFETLAAGPTRSFGIHAFPAYTAGAFATQGLSILDFGVKYHGYTSDVTLTFARAPLSRAQLRLLTLTEKAYNLALGMVGSDVPTRSIAVAVDQLFTRAKKFMPHGLGHGIGLEAHEAPAIRSRADNDWVLKPGMIFTLEPGLYDPLHGGCRLENDILITETGVETLTNSRIIYL
jgi:Xaa-Pro dipeptidase